MLERCVFPSRIENLNRWSNPGMLRIAKTDVIRENTACKQLPRKDLPCGQ